MFWFKKNNTDTASNFRKGKIWGTVTTISMIKHLKLKTKSQILTFLDNQEHLVNSVSSNHFDIGIVKGVRKLKRDVESMKIEDPEIFLVLREAEYKMKDKIEIDYNQSLTECLALV